MATPNQSAAPQAAESTPVAPLTSDKIDILNQDITRVVGQSAAKKIARLNLKTVIDLLSYLPRKYAKKGDITQLDELVPGQIATVMAKIVAVKTFAMRSRPGTVVQVEITDEVDTAQLVFFARRTSIVEYYRRILKVGSQGLFSGKVTRRGGQLQLAHPEMEFFHDETDQEIALEQVSRPLPIYRLKRSITSTFIATAVDTILSSLSEDEVPEIFPAARLKAWDLPPRLQAWKYVHQPQNDEEYVKGRRYFLYAESYLLQLALANKRQSLQYVGAVNCQLPSGVGAAADESETSAITKNVAIATGNESAKTSTEQNFVELLKGNLPFALTAGQEEVWAEISSDISRDVPMRRLLQGEVGSGKTVVALLAMLQAASAGKQAMLLAPTEILVEQHLQTMQKLLAPLENKAPKIALLTAGIKTSQKRQTLCDIASGDAELIIGTQSLFNTQVNPPNLGLVIIDEQHRFGVKQRNLLLERGENGKAVHLLAMTATPIPRTVAQTVFGDLDLSELRQMPSGRAEVKTQLVPENKPAWCARLWEKVAEEIAAGGRVFVVCPQITGSTGEITGSDLSVDSVEDDDDEVLQSDEISLFSRLSGYLETDAPSTNVAQVVSTFERLQKLPQLSSVTMRMLHGQMEPVEKQAALEELRQGTVQLIVATSVIEVGIDIPDATVMVIIDADRFGLAQLHQLRGRIGRGNKPGICFVMTKAQPDSLGWQRLKAFTQINDGFALAEEDLRLRSEGNILGGNQAGRASSLQLIKASSDAQVISQTRCAASEDLQENPGILAAQGISGEIARLISRQEEQFLGQV